MTMGLGISGRNALVCASILHVAAALIASLAVVPCLKDIALAKSGPLKGSLTATLVTDHNGHMR